MAPVKRKAVTDERPQKKAKAAKPGDELKAARSGAKTGKPTKSQPRDADAGERKGPVKSVLQQEERSFPRGGASVLTPIEEKQVRAQAERDVLYEQRTGQKAPRDDEDDGDLFDAEEQSAAQVKKAKKKAKKGAEHGKKEPSGTSSRIQGLSYKTLIAGSMVLGRVTAVTGKDVAVALPNNLTGFVPITAVSERLNKRIESLLEEDPAEDDDEEDKDVDLKKLFYVGQWLRVAVTATGSDSADNKTKRHIELSVDPAQVNGALEQENVVSNSMIQASVRSVEDHGIIMDLGLAEPDVKGFVSKKELGAAYKLDDLEEGQVMLCLVTGKGSDGKVLKLSPDAGRFSALGTGRQVPVVSDAPIVDAFLPGTAVDILVTETSAGGVVGKIMGMVNVTTDLPHSGAGADEDLTTKYKMSSKTKARITWTVPDSDGGKKVGISLLESMLTLPPPPDRLPENATPKLKTLSTALSQRLPTSSFVDDAKVTQVLSERGLYFTLPAAPGRSAAQGFAHISQVSDSRIDSLSSTTGAYKLNSTHKVRVLGFNPIDNVYYVTLKQSILDQPFLRLEDLEVGGIVKGKVDRLILGGAKGITGVLVKLSESVTGLVPDMHLSDVQLQHPERKFREGFPVTARVLSVDLEKRHVRLTMKKTLLGDSALSVWKSYEDLKPDMEGKGTIVNRLPAGAVVQFFGSVRAWLPVAEISEAYVKSPVDHFRLGQTVSVRILSVDVEAQEMKVSCKAGGEIEVEMEDAWEKTTAGQTVTATVTEKAADTVFLDLDNGLKGTLRTSHLVDGSAAKAESALKRIRVGQKLSDLVVLNKNNRSRQVMLTNKPSLVEDAKAGKLVASFADVKQGNKIHGFVRNVTPEGVYVEFANGTVGLVPKSQVAPEMLEQERAFGLRKDQSLAPWVLNVDAARDRFLLSLRPQKEVDASASVSSKAGAEQALTGAEDPTLRTTSDLSLNKVTKARIASIKGTQLNVRLAENAHGRIDVSEVFDSWDEIKSKKAPLQHFAVGDVLDVKILGVHDSRNHRFLPITHRHNANRVFELSAKKSRIQEDDASLLSGIEDVKQGGEYVAFINNHAEDCVWLNLSPSVRGRVALMDLSDDAGLLADPVKNFPSGCALKVRVKNVMPLSNRLDLIARDGSNTDEISLETLTPGSVVAGRVTKSSERSVTVQLSDKLAGPVPLTELSDDFDLANPAQHSKNDIVRVCVLSIDKPHKKLFLSLRPSKVLSSSLPVKDAQIPSISAIKAGDLVRGFVKHVTDKGVIVSLSATVDAFVRVADLSDQYIKDWKSFLTIDQLVRGRIIAVDAASKHIQLSLKASTADPNFVAPLKIDDLKRGDIVTGKVRKVEEFGVFVDLDNCVPRLSGLCHKTEVADRRIVDVKKVFGEGDKVKCKVLKVDVEARKISLGCKASYFKKAKAQKAAESEDEEMESEEELGSDVELGGVDVGSEDEDEEMEDGVDLEDVEDMDSEAGVAVDYDMEEASDSEASDADTKKPSVGLTTSGFDWNGDSALDPSNAANASDSEAETQPKKKKRNKSEIKVDLTADLDKEGPRSTSDFERLLLGSPNDSELWIKYMAFQLQLGEVQKARELAERAVRSMNIKEQDEKANIWTALLNLEVEYGDEERVESVFKQAVQVQEPLAMHEKLASIYIDSGKLDKADAVFDRIVANKSFRAVPDVWLNYSTFLMTSFNQPDRARQLLPRAMKSVPKPEHRLLTAKFAALEFRSSNGDAERGRTIFENLVGEWPKWTQGWDMWVDIEISKGEKEKARQLFERMTGEKMRMKKRRARFVFKRWMEFEEREGSAKDVERVEGIARQWVERAQAKKEEEGEGDEE